MKERRLHSRHVYAIQNGMGESIATAEVLIHHDTTHWISNLWVHPDHRRQGIARTIMAQIIDDWASVDLYLHVTPYTDQPVGIRDLRQFYSQDSSTASSGSVLPRFQGLCGGCPDPVWGRGKNNHRQ